MDFVDGVTILGVFHGGQGSRTHPSAGALWALTNGYKAKIFYLALLIGSRYLLELIVYASGFEGVGFRPVWGLDGRDLPRPNVLPEMTLRVARIDVALHNGGGTV